MKKICCKKPPLQGGGGIRKCCIYLLDLLVIMYVGIVYAKDPPTKMKISNGEQAPLAKEIS